MYLVKYLQTLCRHSLWLCICIHKITTAFTHLYLTSSALPHCTISVVCWISYMSFVNSYMLMHSLNLYFSHTMYILSIKFSMYWCSVVFILSLLFLIWIKRSPNAICSLTLSKNKVLYCPFFLSCSVLFPGFYLQLVIICLTHPLCVCVCVSLFSLSANRPVHLSPQPATGLLLHQHRIQTSQYRCTVNQPIQIITAIL